MKASDRLGRFLIVASQKLSEDFNLSIGNLKSGISESAKTESQVTEIKPLQYDRKSADVDVTIKDYELSKLREAVGISDLLGNNNEQQLQEYNSHRSKPKYSKKKSLEASIRHKTEATPTANTHRKYLKISEDILAYNHAFNLIQKMEAQRREINERKEREKKYQQERIQKLKKETQEIIRSKTLQAQECRREVIAKRIEQEHRRHEEFKTLDQIGNSLVKQIQSSQKSKTIQILQCIKTEQDEVKKQKKYQQKPSTTRLPIKKYQKGKFACLVQEKQREREQEAKMKEQRRHSQLQRRKKYGQLVTSLLQKTVQTQDHNSAPKLRHKQKSYSVNSKHPHSKTQSTEGINSLRKIEIHRFEREKQLRNRTNQRLKELQLMDQQLKKVEVIPTTSTKYRNYIKHHPRTKHFDQEYTKKIISSKQLTKQQKYSEIMSRAFRFQHKAKLKQQTNGSYEQMVGNMVSSIQAKLELLKIM